MSLIELYNMMRIEKGLGAPFRIPMHHAQLRISYSDQSSLDLKQFSELQFVLRGCFITRSQKLTKPLITFFPKFTMMNVIPSIISMKFAHTVYPTSIDGIR